MRHAGAGKQIEQFTRQMGNAASTRRSIVQYPRFRFGVRNEFGNTLQRHRWMHYQHKGGVADQPHRQNIVDRIKRHFEHRRIGGITARHDDRGIAVRTRAHRGLHAERAAATGAVVDDHRLLERLGQLLRQHTGDDIGATAGGEGHNQTHRLGRIIAAGGQRATGTQHHYADKNRTVDHGALRGLAEAISSHN